MMSAFSGNDKPIGCIHDSFLVRGQDEEILRSQMAFAYGLHTDGFKPIIT